MKVFRSSKSATCEIAESVVALGNFDGVHLAHQKLLSLARNLSQKLGVSSSVYTFFPTPVKILSPESAPPLVQTIDQRIEKLESCKIDFLVIEPFSIEFARLSPEEFFKKILLDRLQIKGVVAGYDFTFGNKRSGTTEVLHSLSKKYEIECEILEATHLGEVLISSTQIRQLIRQGEIEKGNALLGSPFTLIGSVISGEGIGRKIGFPTANLQVENELLPPTGVYKTQTQANETWHESITNIGYRPTFGGTSLTCETHLLNFASSLENKKIKVQFLKKIRDEKKFNSVEELVRQIKQDVTDLKK